MDCPSLFTSTMYETANETVLFCQEVLTAHGQEALARHLETFTPVRNATVATMTLDALKGMRGQLQGAPREYVDIAVNAVSRALRETPRVLLVTDAPLSAVA